MKPIDVELRQSFIMGLTAFTENSFPKKCESCNKIYVTRKDLLRETQRIVDDELTDSTLSTEANPNSKSKAVNISRDIETSCNCTCGSKLVCVPIALRTPLNAERSRRKKFGVMLDSLVKHGIEVDTARVELIKLLAGQPSKIIQDFTMNC